MSDIHTASEHSHASGLGGPDQVFGAEHEALGITRTMTETFNVGGYRYTSLSDALAQAKRLPREKQRA